MIINLFRRKKKHYRPFITKKEKAKMQQEVLEQMHLFASEPEDVQRAFRLSKIYMWCFIPLGLILSVATRFFIEQNLIAFLYGLGAEVILGGLLYLIFRFVIHEQEKLRAVPCLTFLFGYVVGFVLFRNIIISFLVKFNLIS